MGRAQDQFCFMFSRIKFVYWMYFYYYFVVRSLIKNSDYFSKMNWDVLSHWCERKFFPAMSKFNRKAVIVLDRATYHTKLDDEDRKPVTSSKKTRLILQKKWGGPATDWPSNWENKIQNHNCLSMRRIFGLLRNTRCRKSPTSFKTKI